MSGVEPAGAPLTAIRRVVAAALAEDLEPVGDLTGALVPAHLRATAELVARAPGVLAGTACATEVYTQVDPAVKIEWLVEDGDEILPGAKAGRFEGPLRSLLAGERTALNFLCHLSGVATLTRAFVRAAGPARVWDTRKTLPGLRALEKAAVRAGGGHNHRGSLSEMVLVKDNHLVGLSVTEAVARARGAWPARTIEVECDRIDQVAEAVDAGAGLVMLDNMTPELAADCVRRVRASGRPDVLVEVSGGVTIDNVAAYARAGADLISTSAITQSAPALDLGLDLAVDD